MHIARYAVSGTPQGAPYREGPANLVVGWGGIAIQLRPLGLCN